MAAIGDNFVKLLPFVLAYFGLSLFHDWSWGLVECNVFVLVLLWAVSVWAGKIEELDWFAGRTAIVIDLILPEKIIIFFVKAYEAPGFQGTELRQSVLARVT